MAQLVTDQGEFSSQSRLVAIRLANLTLRLRTRWTELFGSPGAAAIILAIAAIRSERLLREPFDPDQASLSTHLPDSALGRCNITSIASASGFTRETTRRKVNELLREGLIVREAGEIRFAAGFTQQEAFLKFIEGQLEDVRKLANELLREAVFSVEE